MSTGPESDGPTDQSSTNDFSSSSGNISSGSSSDNSNKQLAVANISKIYDYHLPEGFEDHYDESVRRSLIDHSWSRRILELVGNKVKLLESFSWLSTVGGGYSALGERDKQFSARAGALSLGQQLRLAELLGDDRLKVMCHLFGALASLQMNNKHVCLNYIRRVIIPMINAMPYRDPILTNILRHICFRMSMLEHYEAVGRNAAIENAKNAGVVVSSSVGSSNSGGISSGLSKSNLKSTQDYSTR